jgi:hypothetical protein
MGVGAAIARGSQEVKGYWALLVKTRIKKTQQMKEGRSKILKLVNFWENKKTINTRNSLSPKRFVIIVTNPLFCLFRFRKNRIKQKDEIPSPSHPRNKIRGGFT